MALLDPPKRL
jgi:hypothetical protein